MNNKTLAMVTIDEGFMFGDSLYREINYKHNSAASHKQIFTVNDIL